MDFFIAVFTLFCVFTPSVVSGNLTSDEEKRLDRLESKVDLLSQELGKLQETISASLTLDDDIGIEDEATTNPIQVLSVSKDMTSSTLNNTFEVRYKKKSQEISFIAYGSKNFVEVSVTKSEDDRVPGISTATIKVSKNHTELTLIAVSSDRLNFYGLVLDNSNTSISGQSVLKSPEITFSSLGDITYDQGKDAVVAVTATGVDSISEHDPGRYLETQASVLNLETNAFMMSFPSDAIEVNETEGKNGEHQANITFKTGSNPVSGYLMAIVRASGAEGGIVRDVYVAKMKVLRPTTQAEAFPVGYISILEVTQNRDTDYCLATDETCLMYCTVIGLNVTDIRVYEMVDDNVWAQLPSDALTLSIDELRYFSHTVRWSGSTSSPNEAGVTKHFKCQAKDGTTGTVVSHESSITFASRLAIDSEASNITASVNVAEPSEVTLTMNCAFTGFPRPEATFNLYYSSYNENNVTPDNITPTDVYSWVATKIVTLDTQDPYGQGRYSSGTLNGASCEVMSYATYEHDIYDFNLPPF